MMDSLRSGIVGWVEPTPGIVGFRYTQPNLHCTGVFAKFETQQWSIAVPSHSHCRPISEPIPNGFFSDLTGRWRPAATLNVEPRTQNPEP